MTKIGFLSFGHYGNYAGSRTKTAADALHQAIDLAVGAEEVGADGAFFRVHHFAAQQASPFPLLSAIAARTKTLELGTGVIDMRYENPLYMAEEAAMADLISEGRLQLGVSRGSPETVVRGFTHFGYQPAEGESDADMARRHTDLFLRAITGEGIARNAQNYHQLDAVQPQSPGLRQRIWWGAGSDSTAVWAAEQGMNLMSSTLLLEDKGLPFDQQQAQQIQLFRDTWAAAGHTWQPQVSVSRSVIPLINAESRHYFGVQAQVEGRDQVGYIDNSLSRFGRSYIGEPEEVAAKLAEDAAVRAADTLLVTVPNQLGVDFNVALLDALVKHVKPAIS